MADLYAILKVEPNSPAREIKRAARERRIQTHPDRLERQYGLTDEEKGRIREEAKQVGWAADILTNPPEKKKYDLEFLVRVHVSYLLDAGDRILSEYHGPTA
ncbi:MAG: hypothetical protein Q9163_004306 [Psora crenata]